MPGVIIEDNAVVGAKSLVIKSHPFHAINCMAFPQGEENAYRRFIIFHAIHPRPKGLGFLAWIS